MIHFVIKYILGSEVLPKKEIEKLIKEFLYQQLEEGEAGLTACLVIHTVNKASDKVPIFFHLASGILVHKTQFSFVGSAWHRDIVSLSRQHYSKSHRRKIPQNSDSK